MFTYTRTDDGTNDNVAFSELHLYGSSRLGYIQDLIQDISTATLPTDGYSTRILGLKRYELTNHLGNVLTVITDRRFGTQQGTTGMIKYYEADVVQANDYYPFGLMMPGRSWSEGYRFGYQGSLQDNEINGNSNFYSTYYRELDTRLGRWWSIDPKYTANSSESVYSSMGNNPILFTDKKGDKWVNEQDKNLAKQLKREAQRTITFTDKKYAKYNRMAEKNFAQGKQTEGEFYQNLAQDFKARSNEMRSAIFELGVMEISDIKFTFISMEVVPGTSATHHTTMSTEGVIEMEYSGLSSAFHEAAHGYQHYIGAIELKAGKGTAKFGDLVDEVNAYRRSYAFEPTSIRNMGIANSNKEAYFMHEISKTWVHSILDNDGNRLYSSHSFIGTSVPGSIADANYRYNFVK